MTNVERLLHEAHLRYQREQLRLQRDDVHSCNPATQKAVKPLEYAELMGLRLKPSASMLKSRQWRSVHYYKLFCDHDIPRWMPCKQNLCGPRGATQCAEFLAKLMRGDVL